MSPGLRSRAAGGLAAAGLIAVFAVAFLPGSAGPVPVVAAGQRGVVQASVDAGRLLYLQSCASCHGRVDKMNLMYQASPLTMEWCLSCHRAPEKFIRPKEEVFNMEYVAANQAELGPKLVREYNVQKLTSCSTCHY